MSMAEEIELKLALAPEHATRLKSHPLLKSAGRPRRQKLLSIYFDTPELTLRAMEAALRVRRASGRWVQTLKYAGEVRAGLAVRPEWESPVREAQPQLPKLPAHALDPVLVKASDRLAPVFETDFRRSTWTIAPEQGTEIELCLDQGEIRSRQKHLPLSEVELELKSGELAQLYRLALALIESVPLAAAHASKAERGYALCTGKYLPPVKAGPSPVATDMTVEQGFMAIVRDCLGHFGANLEGLKRGGDPEYLHQARVAVRRLRSALAVFSPEVPKTACVWLVEELRWLMGELGPARDWDVFALETLPPVLAALPDEQGLERLRQGAGRRRTGKGRAARAAAGDPRLTRLLLRLGLWLGERGWREGLAAEQLAALEARLLDFAGTRLARRHRVLLKRGKGLSRLTAEQRHQVRIAAKKMRYAGEFFSSLYPRRWVKPFVAAMSSLQDALGALNDAQVARTLVGELTHATTDAQLLRAAGAVTGFYAHRGVDALQELDHTWRRFTAQKPFWEAA
jgi:triphosphatase